MGRVRGPMQYEFLFRLFYEPETIFERELDELVQFSDDLHLQLKLEVSTDHNEHVVRGAPLRTVERTLNGRWLFAWV
jgi:hypothetical protein